MPARNKKQETRNKKQGSIEDRTKRKRKRMRKRKRKREEKERGVSGIRGDR